jgi:hypothetical protein
MRVVIAGLGKSGTTALVYAVRAAMPADTQVLFEPKAFVAVTARSVAAKVLLHPKHPMDHAFFRQFDHVVLLVRDPRDLLISRALYRIFGARAILADPAKLGQYLELLRAKEADPRAVSMLRINALFESFAGRGLHSDEGRLRMLRDAVAFHEAFPDALVYKYEAMVAGDFAQLARFLSLDAAAMKPDVPDMLSRVVRSRRAGNWRDWFCPEDVAHYRPLLSDYMMRYGYDDDWSLAEAPSIRPEECSEYVMRLVRERHGK